MKTFTLLLPPLILSVLCSETKRIYDDKDYYGDPYVDYTDISPNIPIVYLDSISPKNFYADIHAKCPTIPEGLVIFSKQKTATLVDSMLLATDFQRSKKLMLMGDGINNSIILRSTLYERKVSAVYCRSKT